MSSSMAALLSERVPSARASVARGNAPSGSSMTKWQLALAVGVPLAAASLAGTALLLYLWKRRRDASRASSEESSRPQSVSSEGGSATAEGQPVPAVGATAKPPVSCRADVWEVGFNWSATYIWRRSDNQHGI